MVTNIDIICEVLEREGYKIVIDRNGNRYVEVNDDRTYLFNYYTTFHNGRIIDTGNITYNDVLLAIKHKAHHIKDIYRDYDRELIKYSWE